MLSYFHNIDNNISGSDFTLLKSMKCKKADTKTVLLGGFSIEIKTKIRYLIICCYHIFIRYLILALISLGNPPYNIPNIKKSLRLLEYCNILLKNLINMVSSFYGKRKDVFVHSHFLQVFLQFLRIDFFLVHFHFILEQ